MSIYNSLIWQSDINEVVGSLPELANLAGKSVMVTGCTGLICSAVVDVLIKWNVNHDTKITIIAAGRNKKKIECRFSPYIDKKWFVYFPYDAVSPINSLGMRLSSSVNS